LTVYPASANTLVTAERVSSSLVGSSASTESFARLDEWPAQPAVHAISSKTTVSCPDHRVRSIRRTVMRSTAIS
jgi:hypothetical protein